MPMSIKLSLLHQARQYRSLIPSRCKLPCLECKKRDKILEIGTGSGYQAAILAEMGAKVYTIERYRELFLKAQNILTSLGYSADCFYGDGYEGKPQYGPFNGIIITAAAPEVPELFTSSA